ncbi:DUF3289 family protein [Siccibacter turicensis]|uniref:DUF3289 family protein n=1 Tax=Siccibacter turicensis TaxID=357233 RepID=UPI0023EFBA2C|nr:DUF3289 family protein [Siccibacter turicensis]
MERNKFIRYGKSLGLWRDSWLYSTPEPQTNFRDDPIYINSTSEPVTEIIPDDDSPLILPVSVFETVKLMDDFNAPDMRHGDLSKTTLIDKYGLMDVSARCNAYDMSRLKQNATIMFDELRSLSDAFSFYGPYKHLMRRMIDHMQANTGATFTDDLFNQAMANHPFMYGSKSPVTYLQGALKDSIDWNKKIFPERNEKNLWQAISRSTLPKFDHWSDKINGLGISIHDTWATHITLQELTIKGDTFNAKVHFRVQDHFGLDAVDISDAIFKEIRMFRIWFVLQRWQHFGYRPFITELNFTKNITGTRYG